MNTRLKTELMTKTKQASAPRASYTRFARNKVETSVEVSRWNLDAQASHGSDQGGRGEDGGDDGTGTATISKPKSKTKTPSLYRVILINDDFTPMEFVIHILQKFFQKEYTEATQIMLQVHQQGAGVCGVFTYEIAEMKVYLVNQYSRENRHPLKCTMERA